MKKFLVYLFLSASLLGGFTSTSFAYDITDRDIDIIDAFEGKLFDLIDSGRVSEERALTAIQKVLLKSNISPRITAILSIVVEDLDYYYSDVSEEDYVMTAEDCYDDEYFDAEDQYCYAKEETSSSVNLSSDTSENTIQDFEDATPPEGTEAVYSIDGDTITLLSGTKQPQHQEIWTLYTKAIPSYFRENVKYFNVTNEPDNSVDASVFRDDNVDSDWHIHVNRALYFKEDGTLDTTTVHTLIHEFTHIMTLGDDQINMIDPYLENEVLIQRFKDNCKTFFITEGCLNRDSYLAKFMSAFWTQEDIKKAEDLGGADSFNDSTNLAAERPNDFITEYASTSAIEDIAESFGFFVLKPKPTGKTIADKKILFFYDFPELVKVRDVIRNRLN